MDTAELYLTTLTTAADVVQDPAPGPALSRDPNDDYVIHLARAHDADLIVGGDADLLEWIEQDPPVAPLAIVCGHIGYPWTTEMIAVADKHPNVYIDTSAYSANRYPAELVDYLRGRGRTKVLFGSNYPMLTPAQALAKLGDIGLDDEVAALFLRENASRVFSLD